MIVPDKLPYNYIAIEGNIGVGKTTLACLISETYSAELVLEEFTENSFLEKFYYDPEQYAFPLEISFLVERFNQLQQRLGKKDMFHPFFVADYLFDKSLVFAQNNLKDDQFRLYYQLFETFYRQIERPDLIVYLHNSIPNLQTNIYNRGRPFELDIQDNYLMDIQHSYMKYFKAQTNKAILIIDVTDMNFVKLDRDFYKLLNLISQPWEKKINFIKPE